MSETMENNQGNQEQPPVKRGRTEAERERRREYNRKYMAAYRAAGREKPRKKPATRRPRTDAEREQHRLYMRQYVAEHPERAKLWRERWILKTAAKLQAQAAGGESDGGN